MPIASTDLNAYGSANRPEDDVSTSGGAIDAAARPTLIQLTANDVIEVVSDGADTRTITVTGRDAGGSIVTDPIVLNGTTPVAGSQTFERILKVVASATDGARTVDVRQGAAGPTRATIGPNETEVYSFFQRSASEASPTTRFEKFFWRNDHGTLTLTAAEVTLTADPDTKFRIGVAATKDDTGSVADRTTDPGVTYVDDGVAQSVPGTELAAGEAIGVWVEQSLAGGEAPAKSSFTTELAGTTT